MIPYDLVGGLRKYLEKSRRPSDGLLHCSSDLLGSLRHAQLTIAGAPKIESELVSDVRLETGTLWHNLFRDMMVDQGMAVMPEVKMAPFLPKGWSGTADWMFWDFKKRAFVLGDLKTTKGEGMYYIDRDGAKQEHMAQLSAYYHAMGEAKMPRVEGFVVCYLPMNTDSDGRMVNVEPLLVECDPLPKESLWEMMAEKWAKTEVYLAYVDEVRPENYTGKLARNYIRKPENWWMQYINKALEPPMPRTQKMFWNGQQGVWDVKLVPHWTAQFCPFDNKLCDCSEQGTTKIGHWTMKDGELVYIPRKGYEDMTTDLAPERAEVARRAT